MKLFLSGIACGLFAAIFPKAALWICGGVVAITVLGWIAFLCLVAYLHTGEPKEERP